jgi:hypothetical protein
MREPHAISLSLSLSLTHTHTQDLDIGVVMLKGQSADKPGLERVEIA